MHITIDISQNPWDNRQVFLTVSEDTRLALKDLYGITLEDLIHSSITKELGYLYEVYLRGQEEALRDPPEPTHSQERFIHPNTDTPGT